MSRIDLPKIYNPARQTAEELIDNFVVRTALFKEIFKDIRESRMTHPEQHYIIRGIRGQGKTTLLLRLVYEIQRDKKLSKTIIPICFNEEQYNISRLFKLWETVAEYLQAHDGFGGLYKEMQQLEDDADYEARCFDLLEKTLKANKKKMVLFIDNIDDILNKFSKTERQRLREVFTECAEMRVVGASSGVLEFHHDYGQPFYEFFKTPMLQGLTTTETRTLLLKLSEYYKKDEVAAIVQNQPGRVEALRRITGGVIRTIVIMFQMFADDPDGKAFLDLEAILDSVTPLYKERMDKLSTQHQEIVDCIALNWDAITAGEIAKKIRIPSKAVSAQLKQLEKYHIIEKVETSTKNHLYRISERFFNIWYLMRHGRKWDEKRVRFLVEFLQIWCDKKELADRAMAHIRSVKEGKAYDKHVLYMAEALCRTPIERDLQDQILKETRSYLEKEKSPLTEYLSKSDKEVSQSAIECMQAGKIEDAIKNCESIKHKDGDDLTVLGNCYVQSGNLKKAEESYLIAIEKGHAGAMNGLAWLYFEQKQKKAEALTYARSAFEKKQEPVIAHTYAMVLLWHDMIDKAVEVSNRFLSDRQVIDDHPEDIQKFLLLLIAKKQYHTALNMFNDNPSHLKDRFKPVYYALMHFMKDEYPDEWRKMGGELKETVDEITKAVHRLAKAYA
ncbi:MAG: hypothetical protein SWC96_08540 [Thermodesulfobacteriota bacterium]|nr:hypothetical protein [Thermodesulfobacteriota bacterium]